MNKQCEQLAEANERWQLRSISKRIGVVVGLLTALVLLPSSAAVLGQSRLPPCPADGYFHLCFGTYTFPNGDKYVGEFRYDMANGQGTITYANAPFAGDKYVGEFRYGNKSGQGTYTWASGEKYVGEWRDGKRNGQGTYTYANGGKYVGEYLDDKPNGQGTLTFTSGEKYVGEWRAGKKNGQGTLTSSNGNKYVGEFRDGDRSGQGTSTYPNGDKYVGEFRYGKKNGQGTYTYANGTKFVGEWRDDNYNGQGTLTWANGYRTVGIWANGKLVREIDPGGISGNIIAIGRAKLTHKGGTYNVPVLLNDEMTLDFTLDSGAADVSVSADVVLTLTRIGTIKDSDLGEYRTYRLADGSKVRNRVVTLRSLTVGGVTVTNVEASVTDEEGPLLLGQSFLKRLGSWSIDNRKGELVIVP